MEEKINSEILNEAKRIINLRADYCSFDKKFHLNLERIKEIEIDNLISLILQFDSDRANSATSCDNPQYEKEMLPNLISFFKDKTMQERFVISWWSGIREYLKSYLYNIFEKALEEYNENNTQ